ncbi:MAG: hypothetical protein J1F09_05420 [Oscillospiraceae bacterium]|nr:hypothetical protein [Oscillospiraceae bacterium]
MNKFRKLIRACFYLHCAAALLCIGLSILLGAGSMVIYIAVCALLAAWFALFAVGDLLIMKIISPILDFVLATAAFVASGFVEPKSPLILSGIIMILSGIAASGAVLVSLCKQFLEEYPPRLVRREDYTLLPSFGDDAPESPEQEDELPPLTSEMRELAKQLREILCKEPEKDPLIDEIPEKKSHEAE